MTALLLLAGCAHVAPGHPDADPAPPPVPCLSQADDGLFAICLRTELDRVWSAEFRDTGRPYTPTEVTVGQPVGPDSDRGHELSSDRAYFSTRTGIHFPTRYLDDVRAAHGSRAHIVLTFTLAHETGHHVQYLLHPQLFAPDVAAERQADCYAGVWARREADAHALDAEEFRSAADAELRRLSQDQDEVRGHGTVDQRIASLKEGLRTGEPAACDVGKLTWR